jgi:glycerophosphoryl diester phosphodiesterase
MTNTLIYAHRGANREAAENTHMAFELALNHAVDGIETDIQLSLDEVAVLWHDDDLCKLNLPDLHIKDFTFSQLGEFSFAGHSALDDRQKIISLQDFIASYRTRCRLLLELKKFSHESLLRQQKKILQTLQVIGVRPDKDILVSSFDSVSLMHAHAIAPLQGLVLNLGPEHDVHFARQTLTTQPYLHGLCVHIEMLNAEMMQLVRKFNKFVAVYTCNSVAEISLALTLGVDVLISDVPHLALKMSDR